MQEKPNSEGETCRHDFGWGYLFVVVVFLINFSYNNYKINIILSWEIYFIATYVLRILESEVKNIL